MGASVTRQTIQTRISALRKRMREEGISLYLISNMDFHMSEFVCGYFRSLEYLSGFTGQEAMMVVTEENAHLWTDARYRIQAEQELAGTGIELHLENDPKDEIRTLPLFFEAACGAILEDTINEEIENGSGFGSTFGQQEAKHLIGFDGRTIPFAVIDEIVECLGPVYAMGVVRLEAKVDLVGDIWPDRPPLPLDRIEVLDPRFRGEEVPEKLRQIREEMLDYGMNTAAVFTALDDIAWLFNIRGTDIPYCRNALCYAYVDQKNAWLFIDSRKLTGRVREYLRNQGVTIREYNEFYTFIESDAAEVVYLDAYKNNFAVVYTIDELTEKTMINREGLAEDRKAVKNALEISHLYEAQIADGIAVTRFLRWIRAQAGKVTEREAADYLWQLRKEQGAICPSFETICAYREHAAIVHYIASEETDTVIGPRGLLLVDSGAHYPNGTTDVTRTIPMGRLTRQEKKVYTLVLASMLELCYAEFPEGLMDVQLDVIARKPLWDEGMEFDHATGHGVGFLLNVHEGPQSVCWLKDGRPIELRRGMIMTAEPGMYYEGKFGVRHENMILCGVSQHHPGFLRMVPMTFIPIDPAGIDPKLMTGRQLDLLDRYNGEVYRTLSGRLSEEERRWLRRITKPVRRPFEKLPAR